MKSNWSVVVGRLSQAKQPQIAGALRVVQVVGFRDGALTLGFDPAHKGLLRRCSESLGDSVETVLSEIAGRPIKCRYVSVDSNGSASVEVAPRALSVSSQEKREVHEDPAVKEVLSRFGGEVIDIRKQFTSAAGASESSTEGQGADEKQ